MPEFQIVTGIIRRDDDVLLVRQAEPGEQPYWTVPGGAAEPGEFAADALVREVREETGLAVIDHWIISTWLAGSR